PLGSRLGETRGGDVESVRLHRQPEKRAVGRGRRGRGGSGTVDGRERSRDQQADDTNHEGASGTRGHWEPPRPWASPLSAQRLPSVVFREPGQIKPTTSGLSEPERSGNPEHRLSSQPRRAGPAVTRARWDLRGPTT